MCCAQSCPTLWDPMDCSLPGSSVHGLFRQEYWSGLPFLSPGDLPDSGIEPMSPVLADRFFTTEPAGQPNARWPNPNKKINCCCFRALKFGHCWLLPLPDFSWLTQGPGTLSKESYLHLNLSKTRLSALTLAQYDTFWTWCQKSWLSVHQYRKEIETEFWRKEKNGFYLFLEKGIHGRLVPQELIQPPPPVLGIRRGFYILMKVWIFFPFAKFQNGHSWHQTTQQPGLVSLKWLTHDRLSEMQDVTREYRGRRMPHEEYNLYGVME